MPKPLTQVERDLAFESLRRRKESDAQKALFDELRHDIIHEVEKLKETTGCALWPVERTKAEVQTIVDNALANWKRAHAAILFNPDWYRIGVSMERSEEAISAPSTKYHFSLALLALLHGQGKEKVYCLPQGKEGEDLLREEIKLLSIRRP